MPPDPTPLTEAEIREVEHAREYATAPYSQISNTDSRHEETRDRCIVWRLDDAGNDFATFTGENAPTNAVFYILAHKHLPALLAAARENAGLREKADDLAFTTGTVVRLIQEAFSDRDAALNLAEARENNGPHSRTALMESLNRAMNAQASLIRERDAALARVAELERQVGYVAPIPTDDTGKHYSWCNCYGCVNTKETPQ